ncbi:MAG: cyclopropane-fatty-acyl-phospholipid synthase family protein [bacterium]|nr:cyclopropane-fatty-acyl-phospholipid synthase family protein [bacterium]
MKTRRFVRAVGKKPRPMKKMSPFQRIARRLLFSRLEKLQVGRLDILEGEECARFGVRNGAPPLAAVVTVEDPRFYTQVLLGGSIGASESYMAGHWHCSDLAVLIRLILGNREVLFALETTWEKVRSPLDKLYHRLRRNTRAGSRTNIEAHYDLGNDFYALFLDKTMTYSCGLFETSGATLEQASVAKYERICKKLRLNGDDHLLEIGTGWGGFALHAATQFGCRVTTTTVSRAQYEFAQDRIRRAGLENRVELLLQDYRDLRGCYDKLVSIEMIEAVGHHYLETFFGACSRLLKEDGLMVLQAITIEDQIYDLHTRTADFIKRYIFPGSCIPSLTAICHAVTGGTDMRLAHLEEITPHYVRTLRQWRQNFFNNLEAIRTLGYDDRFIRMWEYYFCYCEGGFEERYIRDVQAVLMKPRCDTAVSISMLPQGTQS